MADGNLTMHESLEFKSGITGLVPPSNQPTGARWLRFFLTTIQYCGTSWKCTWDGLEEKEALDSDFNKWLL